jgi:hypothetical protein
MEQRVLKEHVEITAEEEYCIVKVRRFAALALAQKIPIVQMLTMCVVVENV